MSSMTNKQEPLIQPVKILYDLISILIVAAATAGLAPLRDNLSTPIVALLYLLAVLICATQWGLGAGIIASVCAFLAFNYFFLQPYNTLTVHRTQDIIVLFVFLVVAIVSSQLVGRVRASLAEIKVREHEISLLYEFSGALLGLRDERTIAQLLADRAASSLAAQAVVIAVLADEPFTVTCPDPLLPSVKQAEEPLEIIPLLSDGSRIGEIRIWLEHPLDITQQRLINAFSGQCVLALERAQFARTETRARVLEESDRLKTALLSSVSHELRTPLVTIKAAVTSLRGGEVEWSSPARDELLAALDEETDHLNQLVGNLLNMSRLEAGALQLERQWHSLSEVIDLAVPRVAALTHLHRIIIDVPEDLPPVPLDVALFNQVFSNLISNCVKYSPTGTPIAIAAAAGEDDFILVQITNEGPPVKDQDLYRIF